MRLCSDYRSPSSQNTSTCLSSPAASQSVSLPHPPPAAPPALPLIYAIIRVPPHQALLAFGITFGCTALCARNLRTRALPGIGKSESEAGNARPLPVAPDAGVPVMTLYHQPSCLRDTATCTDVPARVSRLPWSQRTYAPNIADDEAFAACSAYPLPFSHLCAPPLLILFSQACHLPSDSPSRACARVSSALLKPSCTR